MIREKLLKYLGRYLRKFPKIGIDYIEMVGLSKIRQSQNSTKKRIFWILSLLLGLTLAVYYITIRLQIYFEYPVIVSVTPQKHSFSTVPAVTVCAADKFDYHNLMKLWKNNGPGGKMPNDADKILLDRNLTQSEIWRRAGYTYKKMIRECMFGPGFTCEEKGTWKANLTPFGLCYTYSGGISVMSGHFYGIYLKLDHKNHPYGKEMFWGYQIAIHDPKTPPSVVIGNGFQCIVKDKRGCFLLISVNKKNFQLLDRDSQPCTSDPSYVQETCEGLCVYSAIIKQVGCRLPYMDVPGRECSGRSEIEYAESVVWKQIRLGGFDISQCKCPVSCTYRAYQLHRDSSSNKRGRISTLKIYLAQEDKNILAETYSYTQSELGSEIGGIVGLLLGTSVLTLFQLIEVIGYNALRYLGKKIRKYSENKK